MFLNADMSMRRWRWWGIILAVKWVSELRLLEMPIERRRRRGCRHECRPECGRGLSRPVAADSRWCLYPLYV